MAESSRLLGGFFLVGVFGACLAGAANAGVLVVDGGGQGDYTDIQSALDAASDGDTILVKPGTYEIDASLDLNRLHDPASDQGPPLKDLTLRGEGGAEATLIRWRESTPPESRRSVLIVRKGESRLSVIEGLTISGGAQDIMADRVAGGGILVFASALTIRNCVLAGSEGAGLALVDSTAELVDSLVEGNMDGLSSARSTLELSATTIRRNGNGGNVEESTLRARDCVVEYNLFFGLHAWKSRVSIEDSTVRGHAGEEGAGLRVSGNSALELRRSEIVSNRSSRDESGGAVSISESEILAEECLFLGNRSGGHGGAIHAYLSTGRIVNCLFAGNSVAQRGGALDCRMSPIEIRQCTFAGNAGSYPEAPAIDCYQDDPNPHPTLHNSISWPEALGACVESRTVLVGVDPGFVRAGTFDETRTVLLDTYLSPWHFPDTVVDPGDYRLAEDSPAIDAGALEGIPAGDLEGKVRPCGTGVDLGAYESPDCGALVSFRRGDVDGGGSFDLSDPIAILGYLFLGDEAPACLDAADLDDSDEIEISDAIQALSYLFLGGPPPQPPFEACGRETQAGVLDCASHAACRG